MSGPGRARRLRVLHVLEALEGGTARHVVDVVRHASGVEHDVVTPLRRNGSGTDVTAAGLMVAAGATLHRIDLRRDPVRVANGAAVVRLTRLIRQRRPAVVHTHSSIGGLVGRLAARACGVPTLYTPNGVTDVRAGVLMERVLGRAGTDRLVAVSDSERDHVQALRLVRPDRVVVIPNGIDLDAAPAGPSTDLRRELGLAPDAVLVGSISRLVPQKAPEDLAAAFAAVARARPDASFVVIGDGPLRASFGGALRRHRIAERVHLVRYLENASTVLDQLDVFVLASRFEGAPYAPMEAIRAGTPVVATDVVGTRDVIEHRVSGLLAPVGAPDALAALVLELLDDDGARTTLVESARRRLAESFDVVAMGHRLDLLYQELAARGAPRAARPGHRRSIRRPAIGTVLGPAGGPLRTKEGERHPKVKTVT